MARVQKVGAAAAIVAAGAVVAGVALASGAKGPGSREAGKPALRLLTTTPLALRGSGFEPASRVRVTLTGAGPARTTTASTDARGGFRAAFGWVALDPCRSGMIVVPARGLDGRRATYQRPCRTAHRQPGVLATP